MTNFGVFARNHHGVGFHHDVAARVASEPDAVFGDFERHRRRLVPTKINCGVSRAAEGRLGLIRYRLIEVGGAGVCGEAARK